MFRNSNFNGFILIKIKNRKYHTFPKSNNKFVERGTIDTPNTQINDHSLSWIETDTSVKKRQGKTSDIFLMNDSIINNTNHSIIIL